MASFNTTVGQMTEMFQRKKRIQPPLPYIPIMSAYSHHH